MTVFHRATDAVEMTVDDTLVVVDPGSDQMVTLNGVAGLIWSALAEASDLDRLVAVCTNKYPEVDETRIRSDVAVFLDQAIEVGVISAKPG